MQNDIYVEAGKFSQICNFYCLKASLKTLFQLNLNGECGLCGVPAALLVL